MKPHKYHLSSQLKLMWNNLQSFDSLTLANSIYKQNIYTSNGTKSVNKSSFHQVQVFEWSFYKLKR